MKKIISAPVLAFAIMLMLASCGEKENKKDNTFDRSAEEQIDHPASPEEAASNELHIESNDQMQYTTTELHATTGKISLTLKHIGKMDKSVMGHNLVILKPGTDAADFALKAVDAKDSDYIPASESGNIVAHTKVIGGGESDTIEFTITEKGTYDFICSFPGHYAIMKGKLIVE